MKSQDTIVKDLVLIGGGHSHVAVLRMFGMKPMPGVRITMISRDVYTPYSGMLPGFVAGHYDFDKLHIDLRPLSQFAGARLYNDEAICIDHVNKKVICKDRPPVPYDVLSINIGSTPQLSNVPGAAEHATPVKPINSFVNRWECLKERILEQSGPHKIAVVGAGAAGVEILLAVQFRLKKMLKELGRNSEKLELHLVSKGEKIMPQFPASIGKRFEKVISDRGIILHRGSGATEVSAGTLKISSGKTLKLDEILWVTAAGAAEWLGKSGLDTDSDGFVTVNDTLESTSHSGIFAVGDIATVVNYPRPKAGVFAVRQGKPLANNLKRALLGKAPKPFKPQSSILALISTGDKYAVATRGNSINFAGKWVWTWKDWIDARWMAKYRDLPEMNKEEKSSVDSRLADQDTLKEISAIAMRCGGCGAKVGANVLTRALAELKPVKRSDVLIGLHEPDDAAVIEVPPGKVLVNTVDYFRAFIDDPYIFGKVAANHSLSDVFAMGAEAQSALAIATVPYGLETKVEDTINQLMAGAMEILADANCALVGGHTSEGAELALGFSVNGLVDKTQIMRKGGMMPGNMLILTKPLGTGTLFAADMQQKAKGRWVEEALRSMVMSNRRAAECLYRNEATACTDVTGFGLLGHMVEMIKPSSVDVEVDLRSLPIMDGALESVRAGILSTLQPANVRLRRAIRNLDEAVTSELYPLVFDPQTSGGLLASVPANRAEICLNELYDMGYDKAAIVGRVKPESNDLEPVTLAV